MPLSAGDKLGPYEILGLIGKGGMGEVYRAHDGRLRRDVAIKVSNDQFTERFTREARAIASLNHTNICHLYDVGPNYLVMEYVEGADLKGPLEFDEALPIVQQLIDGIEAAHEKSIIHRDLKPANIKITPEGVVKILDFGLAKAMEPAPPDDPANSPTMTMGATVAGTILGTPAYMAPEQAKGRPADKRSDIWSFGVILYELLTGKRMFQGESAVEILGGVLNQDPDISAAPARVRKLLGWCLEKDRKQRLQSIGDARRLLLEVESPVAIAVARQNKTPWAVAAGLAAALIGAVVLWAPWRGTRAVSERPLVRLSVDLGKEAERDRRISVVLSPDGTRIVFAGTVGNGTRRLYTRRLDQATPTLLASNQSVDLSPFFSPDGEWVGFWSRNELYKVPAEGGEPVRLTGVPDARGASWGEDDTIVIGSPNGLWRVSSSGGAAEAVPKAAGPSQHPQFLPGAKAVLVGSSPGTTPTLNAQDIDVVLLANGEKKNLLHGGYWPRYLATGRETGHLVYVRDGTLYGVGFDPRSLELLGKPVPLLNDVAANADLMQGGGQFSISDNGTLVFLSGRAQGPAYPISFLDSSGKITPLITQEGAYGSPRISPDGKQLAYIAPGNNGLDLWVYDLARATPTQLTFAGEVVNEVAWARDSKHVAFPDGKSIWWIRADGAGQRQLLLDGKEAIGPRPFSFGPSRLAFSTLPFGSPDLWTLPIDLTDPEHPKPGKPEPFLTDPAAVEVDPAFSPDGKFLAYSSARNIFVRSFPGPGGTWKVGSNGKFPVWSPATRQIFYFADGDDRIMVADYSIQGDSFTAGVPRVWSPTPVRRTSVRLNFDITPDGKRVVMFPQPAAEVSTGNLHATFLLNFFDEVRRKAPIGK